MKEVWCFLTQPLLQGQGLTFIISVPPHEGQSHGSKEKSREWGEDTLQLFLVNPPATDWETGISVLSQKVEESDISAHRKIWAESSFLSYSYHFPCARPHPQAGSPGKVGEGVVKHQLFPGISLVTGKDTSLSERKTYVNENISELLFPTGCFNQ